MVIHSDASAYACGGHAHRIDSNEFDLYYKAFSSLEIDLDEARELLAVLYSLRSFKKYVKDGIVKIFTDNRNIAIICDKGSTSICLHQIVLDIFSFCFQNHITLQVEWIPRELNQLADTVSRVVDYDDWQVTSEFFQNINYLYGGFTADCFASSHTRKCKKYYSKFWCPGSCGVDAFNFDWSQDNNWLVPPFHLISRTIFYLENCKARGILVVPEWKLAAFWPLFFKK
jgi:hypothetical protein